MDEWKPIETAPRDGTVIFVCSRRYSTEDGDGKAHEHAPRAYIAKWWAEGNSWVDEYGGTDGEVCELAVTGVWDCDSGWFEPGEVTHWMPLPEPPQ